MMADNLPDGVEVIRKNNRDRMEVRHAKDHAIMIPTDPGTFVMGNTIAAESSEYRTSGLSSALEEWFLAATPCHTKQVKPLLVDKYVVTIRQFEKFSRETGYVTEAESSGFGWRWDMRNQKWKRARGWSWKSPAGDRSDFPTGPDFPAVQISWKDAVAYCRWAGKRLPTESEWEYVCRAGTRTRYFWGDDPHLEAINKYAWYIGNSENRVHRVGQKRPNAWGFHDMSGNVWEWVADIYRGYPETTVQPRRYTEEWHVQRGGAWYFHPTYLRSAYRGTTIRGNFVGFRCVMDLARERRMGAETIDRKTQGQRR